MKRSFAFTLAQTKFLLKSEGRRLLLWLVITAGFCAMSLGNIMVSYPDEKSLAEIFFTMQMPMIQILFGNFRYEVPNTQAYEFAAETWIILVILVALMNILLAVRFARKQEDTGTTEFVLTTSAGRKSPLASVSLVLFLENALASLLCFFTLQFSGLKGADLTGNLLFALSILVAGLVFQSLALVSSQVASEGSGATMLSFGFLGIAFLSRILLDMEQEDLQILSPLSWGGAVQPYGENNWLPIAVGFISAGLLTLLSFYLAGKRDIGAGLLPQRAGRARGSTFLCDPITLRWKMNWKQVSVFGVAVAVFGMMFGSLLEAINDLAENPIMAQILGGGSDALETELVKGLVTLLVLLFSVVILLPGIQIFYQIKKDQLSGSLELFYPTGVSRGRVFLGHFIVGLVSMVLLLGISILSIWLGAEVFKAPNLDFELYLKSFANMLPYVLLVYCIAVCIYVFFQRGTGLMYGYVGFSFFALLTGEMFDLPDWLNKLALFGFVEKVPYSEMDWQNWSVMLGVALLLFLIGFLGYRKKDLRVMG